MSKKLTLSISEETIEFAHQYAKNTHQSISSMIEKFLNDLRVKQQSFNSNYPDKTKRLYGALSGMDIPDKKDLRKRFHDKSIG